MLKLILIVDLIFMFFLIRNELVYRAHMQAIALISEDLIRKINAGEPVNFDEYEDVAGGYFRRFLDLTKWTFSALFPTLAKKK